MYIGIHYENIANPLKMYNEIEVHARDEILKNGGTLSHHHVDLIIIRIKLFYVNLNISSIICTHLELFISVYAITLL